MRNFLRSIAATAFTGLLITGAGVSSEAIAANNFDGSWSVVINTLRGDCGSSLRYAVRIVGGRVVGEDASYQVAGAVNPSGAIRVVVAEAGLYEYRRRHRAQSVDRRAEHRLRLADDKRLRLAGLPEGRGEGFPS